MGAVGSHIHSEWDARIQVLSIPSEEPKGLFEIPNGSLLVVPLSGRGQVVSDQTAPLQVGDQVYLVAGESFWTCRPRQVAPTKWRAFVTGHQPRTSSA